MYLCGSISFNNKINLLVSCLENSNVFLNFFFNSSSNSIEKSFLQDGQSYYIKLLLTFLYSRKQLQFLHLSLWIPPVKLTGFDSNVAINLRLYMNLILHDIKPAVLLPSLSIFTTSFLLGWKRSYTFYYFLQYSQIDHQIHLLVLWWSNGDYTSSRC